MPPEPLPELLHTHKVSVCGEIFQIRSDVPAHVIEKIAGFVDFKTKEVSAHSVYNGDKLRLCVLAAMNIAGELFEARQKLEEYAKNSTYMENKIRTLGETLEKAATLQ